MKKMKKGFTIVELVIVIGVIAILSAILIPTFVNLTEKANGAKAKQEVADAYSLYVADAADGVLFDDPDDTRGDTAVKYVYKQNEVAITHGEDHYRYVDGEWKTGEDIEDGTGVVGVDGIFNGCTVKYITLHAE